MVNFFFFKRDSRFFYVEIDELDDSYYFIFTEELLIEFSIFRSLEESVVSVFLISEFYIFRFEEELELDRYRILIKEI